MPHLPWLQAAQALEADNQPFALVTVLRVVAPTSAQPGDKAVVTADGVIHGWVGGGCAQPAVIKTVRRALKDGKARTIRIAPQPETAERQLGDVLEFGMACHSGGTLELFVDPVPARAPLTVHGDSPVARALCDLAPRVGFAVSAPELDPETFPTTSAHAKAWVVVATQGRGDLPALEAALAGSPRCIWFVASARKAGVLKEALRASGQDPARVAAIIAPAGTPIGARTPEEIALSVLAALVAARREASAPAAAPGVPTSADSVTPHSAGA